HGADIAERNTVRLVELRETLDRAVHVDRLVVAGIVDERHEPLRLAERIGTDEMRALGKQLDAFQQLRDFVLGWRMAEDGEPERGFADEEIAADRLERAGRAVGEALVVARDDSAEALPLEQ